MKTKNNIVYLIVALFSFSLVAVSCSSDDDGDTTPPVINLVSPAEDAELKIGENIHFDMELSDNEMLASYKVEIHNDFDGHQHTRSLKEGSATTPFAFEKSWDVSGLKNTKIHHHEIVISENATPGHYHLMVYCVDAAGNESYIARDIILSHDADSDDHDHDHEH